MIPFVGMGGLHCTSTVAWLIVLTATSRGEDGATNIDNTCTQFDNRKLVHTSSYFSDISQGKQKYFN